mmetsp:Transcript_6600/g.14354  ORF Transcript_6600/g.14354 Transcript_6600/m.14354 type:complete len:381 (+) Transcript_6600:87-1229(+)
MTCEMSRQVQLLSGKAIDVPAEVATVEELLASLAGVLAVPVSHLRLVVNGELWQERGGTLPDGDEITPARLSVVVVRPPRAFFGTRDGALVVWDLVAKCPEVVLREDGIGVSAVAVDFSAHRAAVGTTDGQLQLWDLTSAACQQSCEAHSAAISGLKWSVAAQRCVSCSGDASVKLWDTGTTPIGHLCTFEEHLAGVGWISAHFPSQCAVSASEDATLRVWDLSAQTCRGVLQGHNSSVRAVHLDVHACRILSAADDGALMVWDLHSLACLSTLPAPISSATTLCLVADFGAGFAITGTSRGHLHVWDLHTCAHQCTIPTTTQLPVWSLDADFAAQKAMAADTSGEFVIVDLGRKEVTHVQRVHDGYGWGLLVRAELSHL